MLTCRKCGTSNPNNCSRCKHCGIPLHSSVPTSSVQNVPHKQSRNSQHQHRQTTNYQTTQQHYQQTREYVPVHQSNHRVQQHNTQYQQNNNSRYTGIQYQQNLTVHLLFFYFSFFKKFQKLLFVTINKRLAVRA